MFENLPKSTVVPLDLGGVKGRRSLYAVAAGGSGAKLSQHRGCRPRNHDWTAALRPGFDPMNAFQCASDEKRFKGPKRPQDSVFDPVYFVEYKTNPTSVALRTEFRSCSSVRLTEVDGAPVAPASGCAGRGGSFRSHLCGKIGYLGALERPVRDEKGELREVRLARVVSLRSRVAPATTEERFASPSLDDGAIEVTSTARPTPLPK